MDTNFRNPRLYAAMQAYVKAAIELLTRKAEQEATKIGVTREDDYFANLWADALYINNKGDLSELPEYEDCLQELRSDPEISRQLEANVGCYSRGTRTPSATSMMKYIISTGRLDGQYTFNCERFDQEYRVFEDTFYSDRLQYVAVAPLQGLLMENSVVTLSDKLEIRRLIKEEMEQYRTPRSSWRDEWCAVRAMYELPKLVDPGDRCKEVTIDKRAKEIKKEQVIEDDAEYRIEEVVDALRLFGKYTVYHSGIIHLPPKWFFIGSHSVPNRMLGENMIAYEFGSESDVLSFPQFWHKLENPKVKKELHTAVRRFSYSCVRHQNEDKIIDLMIAAETLFLRGMREGEKSFRMSLRAGHFLGTDHSKQKEVYERMRKAYELRSKLVHGGSAPSLRSPKGEITESDNLIGAVGDDMRIAILKAIDLLSGPQAITLDNAFWDKLMFN